jgi:toxin-antitoxin system PIN domain toxin
MIFPDANLLLYAEDSLSPHHEEARVWWDGILSDSDPVNLCWPVVNAYIRIATNVRLHQRPLTSAEAMNRVHSWFEQPCVRLVSPSENHWALFQKQIRDSGAVGGLVADAHLAALAIEHGCTLFSSDKDFAKFPDLRWTNPLAKKNS